nr:hypothetical protein [Lachnospiraceae bacterium]
QVPFGYVGLLLAAWVIYEHRKNIRCFDKKEWALVFVALAAVVAAAAFFVTKNWSHFVTMFNTVYPGDRADAGGMSLYKLFNYIPALGYAFIKDYPASEAGAIISFFPIPTVMILYKWYRDRRLSFLEAGLLVIAAFLTLYCTTGLPMPVAYVTLISRSTDWRAVDVIGYINVLFFLLFLRDYAAEGFAEVASSRHRGKADNRTWQIYKAAMVLIITFDIITGMFIRPIEYGYEAIFSKPVFEKIHDIALEEGDNHVLAYNSIILPSFTTACGADTVNFVNTEPNLRLYGMLDPKGKYEKIYNRYAHVRMVFSKKKRTRFELDQQDSITVRLAYRDVIMTGANYVVSKKKLKVDNRWLTLTETYNEDGIYIYKILYTDASIRRFFRRTGAGLMQLKQEGYLD